MAGENQVVRISYDVGGAVSSLQNLSVQVGGHTEAIKNLTVAYIDVNNTSGAVRAAFKGLTDSGKEATVSTKIFGDQAQVLKTRLKETGEQAREFARAQKELTASIEQAVRAANAQRTVASLRQQFPAPPTATLAQLSQYEAKIARIQALLTSGKLSPTDISGITSALAVGTPAQGLSPAAATTQNTLVGLQDNFAKAGAAGNDAANLIYNGWRRVETIFTRLLIRQSIFAFIGALQQGVRSALETENAIVRLQVASQGTGASFTFLANEVRKLSDASGFKQVDIAAAGVEIFRQRSVSAAEGINLLNTSIKLAQASFTTTEVAASSLNQVMNAFAISNDRAAQTASVLFRTAQVGKGTLEDIASSVSRVALVARELGLSFEQVSGFVATFGRNGLSAGEAATALNSVMQRLLSPSKELNELFRELGVANGQVLVSTFGFAGALQKIQDAAGGDLEKLDKLAGGLKELQSVLAINGKGFDELSKNTLDVSTSFDAFDKAAKTVAESSAKNIQKQFNEISNAFIDIGGSVIKTLDSLFSVFGGLSNVVKVVSAALFVAGTAFVAYKLAAFTSAVATTALSFATRKAALDMSLLTTQARTTTVAVNGLKSALSTFGTGFAIGAAIGTGIALIQSLFKGTEVSQTQVTIEAISALKEAAAARDLERIESVKRAQLQSLDDQLAKVQSYVSAYIRSQNQIVDEARKEQETQKLYVRASTDFALAQKREELAEVRRLASEAASEIRKSVNTTLTIEVRRRESDFNITQKFEQDPFIQLNNLLIRRAELYRQVNDLRDKGDKASLDAAREITKEIGDLNKRILEGEVARTKARVGAGLDTSRITTVTDPDTLRLRNLINVQPEINRFRTEENKLIKTRNDLEEAGRASAAARQAELQKQAVDRKVDLDIAESAIRKFQEFSVLTTSGKLKPEFIGTSKQAQAAEAARQLDELKNIVISKIGPDAFNNIVGLSNLRISKEKEINAIINAEDAKTQAIKLSNIKKEFEARLNAAQKSVSDLKVLESNQIKATGNTLDLLISRITGNTPFFGGNLETLEASGRKDLADNARIAQDLVDKFKEIKKIQDDIQSKGGIVTPDQVSRLSQLRDDITRIQDVNRISLGGAPLVKGGKPADEELTSFIQNLGAIINTGQRELTAQATKTSIETDLKRTTIDAAAEAVRLGKDNPTFAALESSTNVTEIKTASQATSETLLRIETILAGKNPSQIPSAGANNEFEIPVEGFAEGGSVNWAPKGTDTVPAMLTPGEYVWSKETTQRYYPFIDALNKGINPIGLAGGGNVTTVGDVHVTIQGGPTNESTARDLVQRIRREFRRGMVIPSDFEN